MKPMNKTQTAAFMARQVRQREANAMHRCRLFLDKKEFAKAYAHAAKHGFTVEAARVRAWDGGKSLPSLPADFVPPVAEPGLSVIQKVEAPVAEAPAVKSRQRMEEDMIDAILDNDGPGSITIYTQEPPVPAHAPVSKPQAAKPPSPPIKLAPPKGDEPEWPEDDEAEVWNYCRNKRLVVIKLSDGREAALWTRGHKFRLGTKIKVKLESATGDPYYDPVYDDA